MSTWMGWGAEPAARWRRAVLPDWVPWAGSLLGIGAVVLSNAYTIDPQCTPTLPCHSFMWHGVLLGLVIASILGWVRWPAAGAAIGAAAAGVDIAFDPAVPARVACFAYGFACLAALGWKRELVATQREVAAEAAIVVRLPDPATVVGSGRARQDLGERVAAILLVVGILLCGGAWLGLTVSDAIHRTRAIDVSATVVSTADDSFNQRLSVDHPGLPPFVIFEFTDEQPVGRQLPVAVDPEDPTWVEAPWDRLDRSYWLVPTIVTMAALFWLVRIRTGRRRETLRLGRQPVPVEWIVTGNGRIWIRPPGETGEWASYAGGPSPQGLVADPFDETAYRPGLAVGDVRSGGWVQVFAREATFRPRGPLAVTPPGEWTERHVTQPTGRRIRRSGLTLRKRPNGVKSAWSAVVLLAVFAGMGVVAGSDIPTTFLVARGGGSLGSVTITSPAPDADGVPTGTFRSKDGHFVFQGVDSPEDAAVGDMVPAVYLGHGELPATLYSPGRTEFFADLFFLVVSIAGLVGVVLRLRWLMRPP